MPCVLSCAVLWIRSNRGATGKFTTEWILYNILEMKFIEGRKVRDVASRLAMSEADLYRKQRVAVEAVAKAILDMEISKPSGSLCATSVSVLRIFYL
jgi:hypothetical protein